MITCRSSDEQWPMGLLGCAMRIFQCFSCVGADAMHFAAAAGRGQPRRQHRILAGRR